jgi:anti-sigma factor RsiW
MNCGEVISRVHLYLDGELQPPETLVLEAHLVDCPRCRQEYESLVSVVETVRAAQPLYKAPEDSLARTRAMVAARRKRQVIFRAAIAAAVFLVCLLAFERYSASRDRFADFAAETHMRYARGAMPLDVRASEPRAVAGWLSARLPFHLELPNYPEQPGQAKKYSLSGARLLQYREDDVAYLAYSMNDRPISLLIASAARIVPSGGDVYRSGGLSFHTTSHKGLRIITWVDKGLSYALVSDLREVGAGSCVICHGGEGEQRKFAPLQPRL